MPTKSDCINCPKAGLFASCLARLCLTDCNYNEWEESRQIER